MSAVPALEAREIGLDIAGRTILDAIDLEIAPGETWAVVGPNGAGKTSLLRLLARVRDPSRGALLCGGRAYGDYDRRALARRIAYVPQIRPARVPLTVRQIVLSGRYPHLSALRPAPRKKDFEAVAAALHTVGIEALAERPLDQLSGGERQSAFIAAALAQDAEILLLDEPTTHLDPAHLRHITRLLLRLGAEESRTIVTSTHDLGFATLLADRALSLKEGRIVGRGEAGEILAPARLADLFDAPFDLVETAGRRLPQLRIDG